MNLWQILATSRPRFWLYLAGTYLVGAALGFQDIYSARDPLFWAYFAFFLIPANVFLYGINDYFDKDTDQHNQKKGTKEILLSQTQRSQLKLWLIITAIMTGLLVLLQTNIFAQLFLILFFALSFAYSAPPIRLKSRILFDSWSNFLYVIPGIIGYIHASGQLPDWFAIWGFFCWTAAMHLYSAIPDIEADEKAGITTTAVLLGVEKSLLLCGFYWSVFSLVMLSYLDWYPWSLFSLVYPTIILYLFTQPRYSVLKVYWLFPLINSVLGAGVYWLAVMRLL